MRPAARALLAGILVGLSGALLAQSVIDLTRGEVDGVAALAFWPTEGIGGEQPRDPAGCSAVLLPEPGPGPEQTVPCGEWVAPPAGRYRYVLESAGWVSPTVELLRYDRTPFRGRGLATVRPVVPAVRVGLAAGSTGARAVAAGEARLRLLHTESHNRGESPRHELAREAGGRRAVDGLWMPTGPVLAGLWDPATREYLALGRPVEAAPAGGSVRLDPRPPARGADLLAVVDRPALARSFDDYADRLRLIDGEGSERPPDLVVPAAGRVLAVWYGVEGRLAKLEGDSATGFLPAHEVVLRPGRVESVRTAYRPRPRLEVKIERPPELAVPEGAAVRVRDMLSGEPVAEREVTPATEVLSFERMPAAIVEVELELAPLFQLEVVDLSDGGDGEVTFRPRATHVRGRVLHGTEGAPARLSFGINRGERFEVRVATDAEGFYETVLYRSGPWL